MVVKIDCIVVQQVVIILSLVLAFGHHGEKGFSRGASIVFLTRLIRFDNYNRWKHSWQ